MRKEIRMVDGRPIVGLSETVIFLARDGSEIEVECRIDTGAKRVCVDKELADKLGIEPQKDRVVKSALGKHTRPHSKVTIRFLGKKITVTCGIADRSKLKYKALIGQKALQMLNVLVDPQ